MGGSGASESHAGGGGGGPKDTTELVLGQLQSEFEQMLEETKSLLVSMANKTGLKSLFLYSIHRIWYRNNNIIISVVYSPNSCYFGILCFSQYFQVRLEYICEVIISLRKYIFHSS